MRKAIFILLLMIVLSSLFQNCGSALQSTQQLDSSSKSIERVPDSNFSNVPDANPQNQPPATTPIRTDLKSFKTVVAFGDSLTRGHNPKDPANTGIKGYVPSLSQHFSANTDFLNCGISSQTTAAAKNRFSEILLGNYSNCSRDTYDSYNTANFYDFSKFSQIKPDLIIFMIGTNNIFLDAPVFLDSYKDLLFFVQEARKQGVQFLLLSIPPYSEKPGFPTPETLVYGEISNRVKNYNDMVRQISLDNPDIFFVDVFSALNPGWDQLHWDKIHLTEEGNKIISDQLKDALILQKFDIPFPELSHCETSMGIHVSDRSIICDCSSGNQGELLKCENGQLKPIGKTNQKCISTHGSFTYINYHCPVRTQINSQQICAHPVTGKVYDSQHCQDQ